jgi:hypothetical protein
MQADTYADKQADTQAETQAEKQTDRQTDRQTNNPNHSATMLLVSEGSVLPVLPHGVHVHVHACAAA